MKTQKYRITGVAPLIMHNGQLADPLNKWSKMISEISSKRGKTEADHEEMARLEFLGGLYLNGNGPCIPGDVMEATLNRGARKHKKGRQASAGCFCLDHFDLEYDGTRDPLELWANRDEFALRAGVRVVSSKVMRTRAIFKEWASIVEVTYNPDLVNKRDITTWMFTAGSEIGLMDWRPKYGRFEVEVL